MARKSRKNTGTTVQIAPSVKPSFRIGAYVRLSVEDRKKKGDSIENQQGLINAFISENPYFELVETYIDNGQTGQSFERPSFKRMITDMESGKINCCIVKDLSRLGRNAIDTGYYIEKYFPTNGIRFIAITDNYDSADINSGGVMVSLKNMVNEAYALEVGRKVRQTRQMQISKGLFVGRLAPYGYVKSAEDKHKLVPDPYAALIVKQIFDKTVKGESVTEITNWLNRSGILSPMRYFHSIGLASEKDATGHVHWNMNVLYAILQNQMYCGDMVGGKGQTRSYVKKMIPKDNWVIVPNTHEAIVSREVFDAVQVLDIKPTARKQSKPNSPNIFQRKIFCGCCGYSMKRERGRKNSFHFTCATNRIYAKNDCAAGSMSIQENAVKEIILEVLEKQAEVFLSDSARSKFSNERGERQTELLKLQAEIAKTNHLLKSLYENFVTQIITIDEYKELKSGYEEKVKKLSVDEMELRRCITEQNVNDFVVSKTLANISGVQSISDLTAELIDSLIEKILVFDGDKIEIQFKYNSGLGVKSDVV